MRRPPAASDVVEAGKRLGLQTLLAVMQILDQTLVADAIQHAGADPGRIGAGAESATWKTWTSCPG